MSCGFEAAGIGVRFLLAAALFSALSLFGQGKLGSEGEAAHVTIVSFEGKLEFSRAGSQRWDPSYTNQVLSAGDRLRTGERSRALVRFSNTMIRLGELSYLAVPGDTLEQPLITLFKGFFYFFHRDQPGHFGLRTPTASAPKLPPMARLSLNCTCRTARVRWATLCWASTTSGNT